MTAVSPFLQCQNRSGSKVTPPRGEGLFDRYTDNLGYNYCICKMERGKGQISESANSAEVSEGSLNSAMGHLQKSQLAMVHKEKTRGSTFAAALKLRERRSKSTPRKLY